MLSESIRILRKSNGLSQEELAARRDGRSAALNRLRSPYLGWDYSAPETAVMGVAFHALEWLFVRLAPSSS